MGETAGYPGPQAGSGIPIPVQVARRGERECPAEFAEEKANVLRNSQEQPGSHGELGLRRRPRRSDERRLGGQADAGQVGADGVGVGNGKRRRITA